MLADSAGHNANRHPNGKTEEQQELRRASSLLRLLKSSDEAPLEDEELRREFERLHQLLRRIDQIAEFEVARAEPPDGAPVRASTGSDPDSSRDAHEPPSSEDLTPFNVSELEQGIESAVPAQSERDPSPDDESSGADGENLTRWWVNFNGDISLERLSRLRAHLNESPFTIETRFDEITDGLIVLRVVTEKHVSMKQVDWILRQLMDLVGLDRNAAILSQE